MIIVVKGGEYMADLHVIAKNILMYRAKENISQEEMAKRCGVTKQTIYSIENEIQSPSKLTVAKLERVIGEDFSE